MKFSLLLVFLLAFSVSSGGEETCQIDEKFSLDGVLTIYLTPPAFTAVLERNSTCIPLALPASIYSDAGLWNGKQVTIRGETLPNYRSDDAVVTYAVRGRDVTAAICGSSSFVIFVNEISLVE